MPAKRRPSLNPQQRRAVKATAGPLLVLAGAGTGKTHTVTMRIAHLLKQGVAPEAVLAVTFTNKAAGEMKKRIRQAAGKRQDLADMFVGTFHSLCVRILRCHVKALGFAKGFTIADTGEQISIVRKALRHMRGGASVRPDVLVQSISRLKTQGVSPEQFSRRAIEEQEQTLASVYGRYEEGLRRLQALDFDDLLLKAVHLLDTDKRIRSRWQKRFRHVLVDEFQDTSQIQCRLVEILAGQSESLCVVGDDDQSIYAWRGAVPGNILAFEKIFPGAKIIRLEENYRSVGTVLKAANALIAHNEKRHPKELWSRLGDGGKIRVRTAEDQQDEAERIVAEIEQRLKHKDGAPGSYAVILRTNAQTRPFEQELRAARIPYAVIGGTSFYDRKEARDMLSYLTVLANPRVDGAFLRIVNTPPRGIGDKTLSILSQYAAREGAALTSALAAAQEIPSLSAKAQQACTRFAAQLTDWRRQTKGKALRDLVQTVVNESGYEEEIQRMVDDPLEQAARLNTALEVGESLRAYLAKDSQAGLFGFLQEALLWSRDDQTEKERDLAKNSLKLITVHSAKGLEFDRVYIAGFEEELMPHKNAAELGDVDEERRLCYVAITRTKRELTLSYCKARIIRGKRVPCEPSRFLAEIPADLLDRQDRALSEDELKGFASAMVARLARGADG